MTRKRKRKSRTKRNVSRPGRPTKTRAGKTGRWLKAKAVKVIRKNGKLTVMVKR